MSIKMRTYLYTVLLGFIICFRFLPAIAEQTELIYFCVKPDRRDEYLITFQNTSLFGVVVPENATVTVYSDIEVTATIYSIFPDPNTGGYLADNPVAAAITGDRVRGNESCQKTLDEMEIGDRLLATIPLPISPEYLTTVQIGPDDYFDTPNILGVYSFNFRQNIADFQIVQLDDKNIQLSFPFLPDPLADNSYIVISNKRVGITEFINGQPGALIPTEERDIFTTRLTAVGLDLFNIMKNTNVRIYPAFGRKYEYIPETPIELNLSSVQASREPFTPGRRIQSISSNFVDYYVLDNPSETGQRKNGELAVDRILEDGRLIAKLPGGADLVVDSWLVEMVPES